MGLDMYLEGRVSAYKPWKGEDDKLRKALVSAAVKAGLPASDNIDYITITREVAYWRKANQIHNWFVVNVQDGKDDCGHYYVERDQLRQLRDICQQVIDGCPLVDGQVTNGYSYSGGERQAILEEGQVMTNSELAERLLPTTSGFFFGGTDYDQWYISDLQETVTQIDKCLALPEHVEFQYHSSW
jgi:hypothetical protein